ncbi:MAG: hypothetical protein ABW110_24630 [Steroidobacteraceae bacterium]
MTTENRLNSQRPYRVIVWGPGAVGGGCLREVLKQPEFQLVGVLAYSKHKEGVDAGELVGMAPTGVKVTCDKEKIMALDADCVLHCALSASSQDQMDADVIRLLESGKNVVSSASYHNPFLKGKDYVARLEAACSKGKASLHGSGVHPNFILERLGLTLTGLCNRLEHIKVQEIIDISRTQSADMMTMFGFGGPLEALAPGGPVNTIMERYYREPLAMACHAFFRSVPERIEQTTEASIAQRDMPIACMTIEKGTVCSIKQTFVGYLDDRPRITVVEHWYPGKDERPYPQVSTGDYYIFDIEAEPNSIHMEMGYKASLAKNLDYYPGDPTVAAWYATAAPMIQAIPRVCAAPPGLVFPSVWAHYAKDLRSLATEQSIAT